MSIDYRLIVSTNTRLWGAQIKKDLTLYNSHFPSPRWPLWRGSTVFKNTLEVWNYHCTLLCSFAQSSISYFLFQVEEKKKRVVLNRVGADLQMFKSGSNSRRVAWVKNVPGTGYRKEITSCQVGLTTFIGNTLSGYLLNFSSGNVCWHRPGSHLNVGIWN